MGPASTFITALLIPIAALGRLLKKLLKISLFVCSVLALGQLRIEGKVIGEHFLDGVSAAWTLAGQKLSAKGIALGNAAATAAPVVVKRAAAGLEAKDEKALKELLKGK